MVSVWPKPGEGGGGTSAFRPQATCRDPPLEGKLRGSLSIVHSKLPFRDSEAHGTKPQISAP